MKIRSSSLNILSSFYGLSLIKKNGFNIHAVHQFILKQSGKW